MNALPRGAVRVSRVRRLDPTPRRGNAHTSLVAACVSYLNARGAYAWKNQSGVLPIGKRFVHVGRSGLPDVIGVLAVCGRCGAMPPGMRHRGMAAEEPPCAPLCNKFDEVGRLIAVECKTGTGRVSAVQRRVHEELRRRGALVLVIRDIAELEKELR